MFITRHGAGSHYVRPDRVYRTGVLQSMYGFSPQQDVMAVAQAFTTGPYNFMQGGMMPYGTPVVTSGSPSAPAAPSTSQGVAGPSIRLLGVQGMWPPSSWGWWAKFKLKMSTWCASKMWCAKHMKSLPALGVSGIGFTPMGSRAWAANQAAPSVGQRLSMLVAMQQKNQPAAIAMQNSNALMARWNYLRSPIG